MDAAERDQRIGRNIRAVREALGMSQADLASEMQRAGYSGFYPQTIVKIEQGSRALKYAEGLMMSSIVGVDPDAFFEVGELTEVDRRVMHGVVVLHDRHARVIEAFNALRQAHANLRMELAGEVTDDARVSAAAAIRTAGPEFTARFVTTLADDTEQLSPRPPALGEDRPA